MRRLFPIAILLLLPVGAAALFADAGPSLAIYPSQDLPIAFNHALHLEDMECIDCHAADESKTVADRMIPGHETCETCHDVEATTGEETCQKCHPGFDATAMAQPRPVVIPTANLKFDHQVHVEKGVACSTCHGSIDQVQIADRRNLPRMETCLDCHHAGGEATGACSTCHLTGADGKLAKRMPDGTPLVPEIGNPFGVHHGPDYLRRHEHDAFSARQVCAECHTERECLACHDAAVKSLRVHPNDWITLHPVPAKHGGLECQSCHNYQSFCVTCHERVGIGPQSDRALRATNLAVHPPGWNDTVPGPNHHGIWASRDIRSCTSCHREEGCIQCHATRRRSATGGNNPHPPGFRAKACSMYASNARMCLKCHEANDREIARCR